MDVMTEHQMLIEAIKTLGSDGATAFIVYCVMGYLKTLTVSGLIAFVVLKIVNKAYESEKPSQDKG